MLKPPRFFKQSGIRCAVWANYNSCFSLFDQSLPQMDLSASSSSLDTRVEGQVNELSTLFLATLSGRREATAFGDTQQTYKIILSVASPQCKVPGEIKGSRDLEERGGAGPSS